MLLLAPTFLAGCEKNETAEPVELTAMPEIISLVSDKSEIKFGGDDPAIITCEAKGGNISFTWEVDLGDIFPLNNDGSKVRFTGSECCIGEKVIKCTASNDKGEVSKTVTINIYIP